MTTYDDDSTILDFLEVAASTSSDDQRRFSLLVYHRDGVQVVPLVENQPVTIGRTRPSTLTLRDQRLSRQHATFARQGDECWVVDLDSTNGTWVNGERVDGRARINIDDEITLGSISISLHGMTPLEGQLQGLDGHDRFRNLLEEEVVRARTFGRKLSMLMVEGREAGMLSRWCPRIRRLLREVDRIGLYGPDTVEILLSEAGYRRANQLAEQIVRDSGRDEPPLRCGVAIYPDVARTPEELIESSRRALRETSADRPIRIYGIRDPSAPLTTERQLQVEDNLVIRSAAMLEIFNTIDQIASSTIPVLIIGETGSGKEVVARAIHERGHRRDQNLRSINCGAIPEQLVESVLFGHERGAFTGADRQAKGVFEEASGGTVFFDEIGELSMASQVALLRVLETNQITRVGSNREVDVDVRVITATHRDLETMCDQGTFRWDLYYRLNTLVLKIPSLRRRPDDIAPLTEHWIRRANQATGRRIVDADPEVLEILLCYHWPGNVRELRNVIERAVVIAKGSTITVDDLPERLRTVAQAFAASAPLERVEPAPKIEWNDQTVGPRRPPALTEQVRIDFKARIQAFETQLIRQALAHTKGNQSEAAVLLNLPRRTLVYKLRAFDIEKNIGKSDFPPWTEGTDFDFKQKVQQHEAKIISEALAQAQGSQTKAARLLQMPHRSFVQKARKYDLI